MNADAVAALRERFERLVAEYELRATQREASPSWEFAAEDIRAALAAAPLPSEPGKRYQSESGHRLNPRCAELMPTDSFCDCGVNGPDLLAAPLPEPGPIGPVRIRSANCAAGDHDDCLLMVEQDVAELGVTECLCQCHDPLPSDTPADASVTPGLEAAIDRLLAVEHREDDQPCSCDECMSYGAEDVGADWYRIPPANRIAIRLLDGADDRHATLRQAFLDHEVAYADELRR